MSAGRPSGGTYGRAPSPTWHSFPHSPLTDTVAIDLFIVATATFQMLYTRIVLDHDRPKIIHFGRTENPTTDGTQFDELV
jgi:putative transposase